MPDDSDLEQMDVGSGIVLWFTLLRTLSIAFCVCACISLPMLTLFASGTRYTPEELDPNRFARLSIGNVGFPNSNYTVTVGGTVYTSRQIAGIATACDIVIVFILLLTAISLRAVFDDVRARLDDVNVTTPEYSVFVRGLPKDVEEADVFAHFNSLYNLYGEDWTNEEGCCLVRKRHARKRWSPPAGYSWPLPAVRVSDVVTGAAVEPVDGPGIAMPGPDSLPPSDPTLPSATQAPDGSSSNAFVPISICGTADDQPGVDVVLHAAVAPAQDHPQPLSINKTVTSSTNLQLLPDVATGARDASPDLDATSDTRAIVFAPWHVPVTIISSDTRRVSEPAPALQSAAGVPPVSPLATTAQQGSETTPDASDSIVSPQPARPMAKSCLGRLQLLLPPSSDVRVVTAADVAPIVDASNTGEERYLNSWVAEVTLARANGAIMQRHLALKDMALRVRQARARVLKFAPNSAVADAAAHAKALSELEKVQADVKKLHAKHSTGYKSDVVGAFVVFNNEESRTRCVADYVGSDVLWSTHACCQPRPLRFKGKKLTVTPAPDPSQIFWQNLELPFAQRAGRQCGLAAVMTVLLLTSFAIMVAAQAYGSAFQKRVPSALSCAQTLPGVAFNRTLTKTGALLQPSSSISSVYNVSAPGNSLPPDVTLIRNESDPVCASRGLTRFFWSTATATRVTTSVYRNNTCEDECFPATLEAAVADDRVCRFTTINAAILRIPRAATPLCFCYKLLLSRIAANGVNGLWEGPRELNSLEGGYCAGFSTSYIIYNSVVIAASLTVAIINVMISIVVPLAANLEGHKSVDARNRSVIVYSFIAMFINTALLVLIINAALPVGLEKLVARNEALSPVFAGSYPSFTPEWHAAVGASIVFTLMVNVISPHVGPLVMISMKGVIRRLMLALSSGAATQAELQLALAPPPYPFPIRIAAAMSTLFSCLLYSGGHPILLLVCAVAMAAFYVVDKAALLRLYARPPRFDHRIPQFVLSSLPIALVLHLAVTVWMYSDARVLYSPSAVSSVTLQSVGFTGDSAGFLAELFNVANVTSSQNSSTTLDAVGDIFDAAGAQNVLRLRLARENTLPLLLLLLLLVVGIGLYSTAGVALIAVVRRAAVAGSLQLRCGRRSGSVPLTRQPSQGVDQAEDATTALRNPPFTGVFFVPLSAAATVTMGGGAFKLSKYEISQGWQLGRDAHGQLVKLRSWTQDGEAFGLRHAAHERMATWQVIASTGLASYSMSANPAYAQAVRGIEKARLRAERDKARRERRASRRMSAAALPASTHNVGQPRKSGSAGSNVPQTQDATNAPSGVEVLPAAAPAPPPITATIAPSDMVSLPVDEPNPVVNAMRFAGAADLSRARASTRAEHSTGATSLDTHVVVSPLHAGPTALPPGMSSPARKMPSFRGKQGSMRVVASTQADSDPTAFVAVNPLHVVSRSRGDVRQADVVSSSEDLLVTVNPANGVDDDVSPASSLTANKSESVSRLPQSSPAALPHERDASSSDHMLVAVNPAMGAAAVDAACISPLLDGNLDAGVVSPLVQAVARV